jgi:hypothetical protein
VSASLRRPVAACASADLAVELAHACAELGVTVDPRPERAPVRAALDALGAGHPAAVVLEADPSAADLVALGAAARAAGAPALLALVSPGTERLVWLALASDLGLVAVDEVRPLASALAFVTAGARRPWAASVKGLPAVDRARWRAALPAGERSAGKIVRLDATRLAYSHGATDASVPVGEPRDVAAALAALAAAEPDDAPPLAPPPGASRQAVLDVVFGPPRALSDPASKAALRTYGLAFPVEELCASPSRAASEATRIGYPVRITLASPDLRVWDHPDLAVDGVDNAARVRDVFRQLVAAAGDRAPQARVLGVTVTATTAAQALLRVDLWPLEGGRVAARVGFADPHGLASGDETLTALPASAARVERALERLRGAELLFAGGTAVRRTAAGAIGEVLHRLAAFVDAHRGEVERVRVHPLALLYGGTVEVREVCVTVGDAFARSLERPASP